MNAYAQWIAFSSLLGKEIRRFLRIWVQTLVPPAITIVLYFLIFGSLIGSRIGEMGGYRYAEFVAPGLIMMAVLTNSYNNVVSSFFGNKFQRCIEELLVSPTPNYVILLGFVMGGVCRGLAVGLLATLVALWFAELHIHNLAIIVVSVLLTAVLFALAGLINAIFARTFDDISIIPTFVLTPLTYLGGIFYSISLLPQFWQKVSLFNPVLYMINVFRYGFLGVSDVPVGTALALLVAGIAALSGWALYLLGSGRRLRS